jgi:hypothetical protein
MNHLLEMKRDGLENRNKMAWYKSWDRIGRIAYQLGRIHVCSSGSAVARRRHAPVRVSTTASQPSQQVVTAKYLRVARDKGCRG